MAFERQRGNSPVAPEELCRAHPELLPQVLWNVRALDALPKPEDTAGRDHSYASGESVCAQTHSRYGKLRFHCSGGLGEVSVACDRTISREVAVKRLRAPFDADPERRERFLREAILTGGLEHPGIVPVYGVGADDDGRPCYAMRLLRGPTLGDAIRSYHACPADSVAFRELLGRFVSVCQAVAYAHERGIVHRDIKPGNVVVGALGETVLLDWGLAKHLGDRAERPIADEANALPSVHTRAGLVMGTPGYMAPELASGEPAGRPADIFSLGATLETLLTNRAPHEPPSGAAKTPLPLAAIARKATSPRPEDRYPSALALADDVNRWLADQSIVAHRDPPWERLARWGRRNRTAVRAGLAALLVSLVVLAVASVLLVRSRDRERTAAELATRRKTEADENYRRAREAVDDLFVSVSEGRLKTLPGAQPYRVELLRTALKYYSRFLDDRGDDPANRIDIAATYSKVAVIVGEVESAAAAVTWDERAVTAGATCVPTNAVMSPAVAGWPAPSISTDITSPRRTGFRLLKRPLMNPWPCWKPSTLRTAEPGARGHAGAGAGQRLAGPR